MPTVTYGDDAFLAMIIGMGCIGLDLSSGDNRFEWHLLNLPTSTPSRPILPLRFGAVSR